MTWTAPQITRSDIPAATGERDMLQGWLDWHRETLLAKCAGLTAEQLVQRSAPPSTLTLLGLVRHMALVERSWFRERFAAEELDDLYDLARNIDADFDDAEAAGAESDFATLRAEIAAADAAVEGRGLDETFRHERSGKELNLRWIYVHMIEEYARHNGHADLLRERIDGATGD